MAKKKTASKFHAPQPMHSGKVSATKMPSGSPKTGVGRFHATQPTHKKSKK